MAAPRDDNDEMSAKDKVAAEDQDLSAEEMEHLLGERPPTRGAIRRDWKLLPKALPYLRPYRGYAIASIVLTVLLALVTVAEPWPLAFVVDSVLGDKPVPGWIRAVVGDGVGALILLAVAATLLLTLLSGGLTVLNEYLTTTVDLRMSLDFRSDLFQHVQRLSLGYHDDTRTGMLMFRLNTQAGAIGNIVVGLPVLAQGALTIALMAFISFRIEPVLALLALGVTPFIFYSTTFYADRIEPRLYRVRGMEAMNMAIVHEAMQMLRVVLAFGHENREYGRFRKQSEKAVDARVDLTVRQTAFQLGVQLITAGGTAAVLGVGAYQAFKGRISAGELIVVLTYIAQVYQPLEQLTTTLTAYQQYFISFRHSYDLLNEAPGVTEKPDAREIGRAGGEFELDGVTFGYAEGRDVLKEISFRAPAGRAIAIVGPTGAGKSTLASLLPRFYDPRAGRVLIDGIDVRDLTLESVRSQYSIVLQEPLLFSTTIYDNILYGKPDANPEEVEAAAKAANAHDFITALPDGYRTTLGERGAKISGGERQRIAVARAFLRDAPILILDEPTSSIDSRTESVILDALDRLMEGRTTIVIAHRLSTIRGVDEILVMDEGQIVQRGPHEELVREPGLYETLWKAQTGAGGDGPGSLIVAASNGDQGSESAPRRDVAVAAPAKAATPPRPKIVLLGMVAKHPVGGVAWQVGQYAVGFERLGYEVYYVEAHAGNPSMFMAHERDDGADKAARFIAEFAARFGLGDRWAFQALHENGRCLGMSRERLDRLYRDAALIINMHGGTLPLPEHVATDRLVFLGTDPVQIELDVHRGERSAIDFLGKHVALFTSGLNYGNPDCKLPWAHPFSFVPSPPPVVLDHWENDVVPDGAPFTTIGNWRQSYRDVRFEGRTYRWSKHQQFLKILDLPIKARAPIELALSSYDDHDHLLLAEHGWRVRPALEFTRDLDSYRDYIVGSAGEVSAAKEQNVQFRTGWFSERSATYLAAGRPVILQDTGFGVALPTGAGLFAFSDLDGAAEAIATVQADPARQRRAAREVAREYLRHDVVLADLLDHVGLQSAQRSRSSRSVGVAGRHQDRTQEASAGLRDSA